MSLLVARTCTKLPSSGTERSPGSESQPLSAYRSVPAYVLLGDPGAGKTTEFVREFEELGDSAAYVKARDFIADLSPYQELQGRTVFIDGLDEMRAGTTDARVPLDDIRRRLVELGRPNFRISCREADWLGPNDRRSLEAISPDSAITVLLLDELNQEATHELLVEKIGIDKAESFQTEALSRGLAAMLRNPQTLELLTKAVAPGGVWPKSRLHTFESACSRMATEHNDEYQAVSPRYPTTDTLDAAGHLCTLLLLCGLEGYRQDSEGIAAESGANGFVPLDYLGAIPAGPSSDLLSGALSTKLFKPAGETELVPRHRQIAEFLAGRYLAELIGNGLPAGRVKALMISGGRVVTVLRGLSAWLAAHSGEARRLLIDADPVGVGLYGDLAEFTSADRECLLRSLVKFAEQGPLFGHAWQDGRADGYRDDTAWAFRSLASADMVDSIRSLLNSPTEDTRRDRTAVFILRVLSEAEESERESLAVLAPDLAAILRDVERPSWVTIRALDAYTRIAPQGRETDRALVTILEAIQDGSIPDLGDDLRKSLLMHLYPRAIRPAELWSLALPRHKGHLPSGLGSFWQRHVLSKSSDEHVAELLDALSEDAARLVPALAGSYLDDLPVRLLDRGLHALGDTLDTERLLYWLDVAGGTQRAPIHEDETRSVRRWLESRPQTQKSVFLAWLRRGVVQEPDKPYRHWFCDALHRSRLPADFGLWCLDQAVALEDDEPLLAQELLSQAYVALDDPSIREGLTPAGMHARVGTGVLARKLEELDNQHSAGAAEDDGWRQQMEEHRRQQATKKRRRREEWAEGLRSQLDDLHKNRLFPPNLNTLAQVYLGMFTDVENEASPRRRIRDFIGDDEALVDAVMAAIREAISRDDVPGVDKTVSLHSESKHSWLAYPVLASLHLLNAEEPDRLDRISAEQKRRALAIYYCVPSDEESHPWHDLWCQEEPKLVLEVLYRCAVAAVRAGDAFVPCLNTLDTLGDHEDSVPALAFGQSTGQFEARPPTEGFTGHEKLVHDVRLRLLDAIPTRTSNKQVGLIDRLLVRAMRYPDGASLRELAARKLTLKSLGVGQRVRWLAVEALLSGRTSLDSLKRYVCENEVRVRHLAEFLRRTSHRDDMGQSVLADAREPEVLRDVIEMLGTSFGPVQLGESGFVTLGMEMSELLDVLIAQLGTLAGEVTDRAFTELIDDPRLGRWRDRLNEAHERQRVVHRDASYRHPSIKEALHTLGEGAPANSADLAALLRDRIADISADLRGGSSNLWRQFWNEDRHKSPTQPKHEDSCRDALLAALEQRLPDEVDTVPEGRYAADNRADIRAACAGFNVPVEIKKNSHPKLWSAIRSQLKDKYTTNRETSGYGIYVVLWFGADVTKPSPDDGERLVTPEALKRRLEQKLTDDEARKISVIVLDVTKPGG